MMNSSYISI